jgi:uncharacterized damage-inducible protein DinB
MSLPTTLTIEEILQESEKSFHRFTTFCQAVPADLFFIEPSSDKWSIAQNLQHLVISTKTTTAAYALPKFLVRLIGGKPNRPSRTYPALVEKYQQKLAAGGKAQGRYIPKHMKPNANKDEMINHWRQFTTIYLQALRKNWKDEQLDKYIVTHPLLGKITLRELCYFTIYHTEHHLAIVKKRIPS